MIIQGTKIVTQSRATSDQIDSEKVNGANAESIEPNTGNQLVVFGLEAGISARPVRATVKGISYNEFSDGEEGEITPTLTSGSKNRKRRKNLRIKASNGPFASITSFGISCQ